MTTLERNKTYKPTMERIGDGLFWMQSATDRNTYYLADLNDQTCECIGFANRGKCWHLDNARTIEAERAAAARTFEHKAQPVAQRPAVGSLAEAFGPMAPAERSGWATSDWPL